MNSACIYIDFRAGAVRDIIFRYKCVWRLWRIGKPPNPDMKRSSKLGNKVFFKTFDDMFKFDTVQAENSAAWAMSRYYVVLGVRCEKISAPIVSMRTSEKISTAPDSFRKLVEELI